MKELSFVKNRSLGNLTQDMRTKNIRAFLLNGPKHKPPAVSISDGIKTCLGFVLESRRMNTFPEAKSVLEKHLQTGYYEESEYFSWIMACYQAAASLKEENMRKKRRYIFSYLADTLKNTPPDHLTQRECEQYQKIQLLALQRMMRFKLQDLIYGPEEYKEQDEEYGVATSSTIINYTDNIEKILDTSSIFSEQIPATVLWNLYFSKSVYFMTKNNYEEALRNFTRCETLRHNDSLQIAIEEKIYFLKGFINCSMHYSLFAQADLLLASLETTLETADKRLLAQEFPSFFNYKGICCFCAERYEQAIEYFAVYMEDKDTLASSSSHYECIQLWTNYLLSTLAKNQCGLSTTTEAKQTIEEIVSTLETHPEYKDKARIITKKTLSTSPHFEAFCDAFPSLQALLDLPQPVTSPPMDVIKYRR